MNNRGDQLHQVINMFEQNLNWKISQAITSPALPFQNKYLNYSRSNLQLKTNYTLH